MSLYGGLLRLYPRDFREEYGEDMQQLLTLQLRDEAAARVWLRTLLDVALTVPPLRLEAHMSARTSAPVVYGAATVASLTFAAVAGSAVGVSVVGLAGVLLFGSLATLSWRRAKTLGDGSHAAAHWWKYLGLGAVGLAACVVAANVGPEDGPWLVFMGAFLTSIALIATGLILWVTHAVGRRTV